MEGFLVPVPTVSAEGQIDDRFYNPSSYDSLRFNSPSFSLARVPARARVKGRRVLVSPPSPTLVPSGEHGYSRLVDSLKEIEDGFFYRPLYSNVSQGVADRRSFSFNVRIPDGISSGISELDSSVTVPAVVKKKSKQVIVSPSVAPLLSPAGRNLAYLQFTIPPQVMICVRRKQRREVLLALGKGGTGFKKPKWNEDSFIRC